jgi:methylated-DNA-protein-cysteine methyltransferase-like protein
VHLHHLRIKMRSSPPDPFAFNIAVWEIVRKIPRGKVTTYGRIAMMIPIPEGVAADEYRAAGARWVGGAMAACPDDVPWQRVINAQGKISERRGGGVLLQKQLLEEEGVEFDDHERVDLKKYGWDESPKEDNQFSLL